jgi:hypothetical protein
MLLLLVTGVVACGREPAAVAPVPPPPPTPTPRTMQQPSAVLFYNIQEVERLCPDYEEYRLFEGVERKSQVKVVCSGPGRETVYYIDIEKQRITGVRLPVPVLEKGKAEEQPAKR